jgi:hypothetical protein
VYHGGAGEQDTITAQGDARVTSGRELQQALGDFATGQIKEIGLHVDH